MRLHLFSKARVMLLFLFLTPIFLFASVNPIDPPIFQGKIINQKTKEVIPFATIQVVDFPGFGTVSDTHGEFQFRRKENWSQEIRIKISFLGFQNKEVTIQAGTMHQIALAENVKELREVIVIPDDFERNLMRQVIERIPENYPNRHERIFAVTTEQTFASPDKQTPFYKLVADVQADIFSYSKKNTTVNVEILDKKVELYPDYTSMGSFITISSGAYNIQRFDLIAQRSGPFKLSNISLYDFSIQDTLVYDNQEYIVMDFVSENEASGKIFINTQNLGVKKIEVEFTDLSKDFYNSINGQLFRDKNRKSMTVNVEYLMYPDNFYRFQYAYYTTYFVYPDKSLYLENIYTLQEFEPGFKAIHISKQHPYSEPILTREEAYRKIMDEYLICISEPDSLFAYSYTVEKGEGKRYFSLLQLHSQISLGSTLQSWDSFSTQLDEPIEYEQEISGGTRIVPLIGWDISYQLTNNSRIYYGFIGSFQQQRYNRFELGIEQQYSLSKTKGHRFLLGVGVGRQRSGIQLEDAILEEKTRIRNRDFSSGETLVFTRQRELVFTPKLGFLFGNKNTTGWLVTFEFPLALVSGSGLYFREQGGGLFNARASRYLPNTLLAENATNRIMQNMPILRLNYRIR
ncbi:carboxypeptidase-like regulatory domain-containing protein [Mongoliitalea daihaiensis]|uniref:carboxypeptidase-like regulatory domain-containing protein n=1 Tax=Mongoliitalea daihaiensis TaxID=2782006 RepID=UPI001F31BC64|nr:carboxypeptidase-like regulatory domain-containing protein [Mongoliitalea daihaiensis]UJP66923.1 carboxypeptidase-like regulatory domain-containing protein [Mongoliitalea daihaiensis]